MGDGNADAAIGFFILISVLAIMFAVNQAKIDKIRADSDKHIADRRADFERRMDEFQASNPKASCSNCTYYEHGSCALNIQRPRHFCLRWSASPDHDEALRFAAMTDEQIIAEIGDALNQHDITMRFGEFEQRLAMSRDYEFQTQGRRALRLARLELGRRQQEGATNA